ncbi:MAG: glycosyltransferase, partial [Planctomycetota bacterium]
MPAASVTTASPRRILHVVARSLPYLNGYTIRTRCIVDTQRAGGLEPAVVTSPYYPGLPASLDDATIDDVPHRRVRHPLDGTGPMPLAERFTRPLHRWRMAISGGWPKLLRPLGTVCAGVEEMLLMRRFERAIVRLGREDGAEIVHVHSPYRCALPAIAAARRMRVPVVYEIRGLWEETAVAEGTLRRGSLAWSMCRRRELNAMRNADAVVVISEALRDDVVERGVPVDRVFVSPNAVDPEAFAPPGADETAPEPVAAVRAALAGRPVVGYVGSIRRLEGVDELIRGAAELVDRGADVAVLVVGDGPELERVKGLARELGLGERARFTGQVPHEHVRWYYGL